ncbi:MAG: homoserine dehydrogenase [Lachnospiraceae bacterium]|nr:homoserine dehydrogenase [Lachnospiraceae bacterium]
MADIAVMGYGTVGSGVVKVLETNKSLIGRRAGQEIFVKYVLDLRDFPGDPIEKKITHRFEDILEDASISVVVEVMGGLKPAYDFTRRALEAGKSVCTSNKELVATHGQELIEIAKKNNVNYLFEASCGGGIPIIRPLNSSLTAEDIDEISGILNGTTNYILTEMSEKGSDFETALKEAQELGYAERNPEADVEGYDACRKIAILSSLAFGRTVRYEDVYTEGITKITPLDIAYAKKMDMVIKLVASGFKTGEGGTKYNCLVSPFMIGFSHPLSRVNGVFNAVFVHGNTLGDSMFYGSGAGSLPTASAVVGDVVDCVRHLGKTITIIWDSEKLVLSDIKTVSRSFFLRVPSKDLDRAKELFPVKEVIRLDSSSDEVGIVTDVISEEAFERAANSLGTVISRIRIAI